MKQFFHIIIVQFKIFSREPEILFWGFVFPILMSWGLGMAFTKKDIVNKEIVIIKNSLIEIDGIKNDSSITISNTKYTFKTLQWDDAIIMLKRGEISMIISGTNINPLYHFDESNPDAKTTYLEISQRLDGNKELYKAETIKPLEKVGTRYIDFLIPGMLAMNIMSSAMWGISYNLIEMRSKRLMRRMVVTPMNKWGYLISIATSRVILSLVEASILVLFAVFYFNFKIEGSLLNLFLIFIAGNVAFLGLAIFISSRTESTQVGNAFINIVIMPMMVCSGIFFSYHNFPDSVVNIIKYLPLTILADNLRSVCIEGISLAKTIYSIGILTTIGILFFTIGIKIYKWY